MTTNSYVELPLAAAEWIFACKRENQEIPAASIKKNPGQRLVGAAQDVNSSKLFRGETTHGFELREDFIHKGDLLKAINLLLNTIPDP